MDLNPLVLWQNMTILNKGVVIILISLSIWSLYVCVERIVTFRKAKRQSLEFAKLAADHLKHDRPQAAIDAAMKYPQSHLA
ncbi:MAG: flagellar motor protein MotA, partial [Acidobacteriota bacterium]|nr:flagellar motor protein MotA [Acidobacteriota bacterium]